MSAHLICPYTQKPLSSIAEVSLEHIFPLAIGGSRGFCVTVDKKSNSDLGGKIDARFVDSDAIRGLRTQQGIKSSSGPAKWTIHGRTKFTGKEVTVTIANDKRNTLRYKKPVTIDPATGERVLFGTKVSSAN